MTNIGLARLSDLMYYIFMQEDFKKKFILLSKIAKEKKYAQEYLGLLARRGDLGSIRIGKRWYTSQEWFLEFLTDAEKRKEEISRSLSKTEEAKISEPIIEAKKEAAPKQEIFAENKNITVAGNKKEYADDYFIPDFSSEIKIRIPEKKLYTVSPSPLPARSMDLLPRRQAYVLSKKREDILSVKSGSCIFPKKNFSRGTDQKPRIKISSPARQTERAVLRFDDMAVSSEKKLTERREENKNEMPMPRINWEAKISNNLFSPSFAEERERPGIFLPRLAFGMVTVLLFLLLFQAAAFFKEDLMKIAGFSRNQGIVAGASDEKINSIADVRSEADYYLSNSADAMKESVSFSRLMVKTALERNSDQ
ncbi:MAG: hypothetical protein Q8L09_03020 [Candidatus Moranbacteria bacterium]|nr:hypothetical protein [Candidatus Moranbacteria bacterium]